MQCNLAEQPISRLTPYAFLIGRRGLYQSLQRSSSVLEVDSSQRPARVQQDLPRCGGRSNPLRHYLTLFLNPLRGLRLKLFADQEPSRQERYLKSLKELVYYRQI